MFPIATGFSVGLVGVIGYTILEVDGTTHTARTTAGVSEPQPGVYHASPVIDDADLPLVVRWDDGVGGEAFATIEADGSLTLAGLAAAVWAFATRSLTEPVATDADSRAASRAEGFSTPADLNGINESVGAFTNSVGTLVANNGTAIGQIVQTLEREDGPLGKTFKDGDNITVDVGGESRTGRHTKAN